MAEALATDFTDHPVTTYINGLTSQASKRTMLSALKTVLALALREDPAEVDPMAVYEFPWPEIDPGKLTALRARLVETYSPSHAAKCFAAVRGVLGACFDLGMLSGEDLKRVERVNGVSVKTNQKAGRRLSDGEIYSLATACANDPTPAGARDDAIIGLGYTQGPRVSEISRLQLSDYDPETGDLTIRGAKGGKTRIIRASNSTKETLEAWIEIRGPKPGPLFCPVNKGGAVIVAPLSTVSVGRALKKRAAEAGVKSFTMHDLRRTFITRGWEIGIPGPQLQTIAGHESIETTAAYDRGDLEAALASGERIHYPSLRVA